ncbi:hypothetical protein [Salinibacter grassmerensis]|uniref:hypothetical protein n=1 Tax=Salinibacter grassmerensis TaxID=3040353 RepID=UPI0021E7C73F|nr:hypothetical protein [Salinibacter grassmerensis]
MAQHKHREIEEYYPEAIFKCRRQCQTGARRHTFSIPPSETTGRLKIYDCLGLHDGEMRSADWFAVQTEAIWSF